MAVIDPSAFSVPSTVTAASTFTNWRPAIRVTAVTWISYCFPPALTVHAPVIPSAGKASIVLITWKGYEPGTLGYYGAGSRRESGGAAAAF